MANANSLEYYMLDLINAARAQSGLAPLQLEQRLNDSAEDHSEWMLETGTFSHTGAGGSSSHERMVDAGFVFSGTWRSGENIAYQSERGAEGAFDDVADLHGRLMDSSGHRWNILNSDYQYVGIGIEFVPNSFGGGIVMVTQNFASTSASVLLDTGSGGTGSGDTGTGDLPGVPDVPDVPEVLSGTSGHDRLVGSNAGEEIRGLAGRDRIDAGAGDDTILGGSGNDWIIPGSGADYMDGGRGFDTVDYYDASRGGIIDLKHEHANTGSARGDTYVAIASVRGTRMDDDLRGNDWDNQLRGSGGNDRVIGRGGDDTLYGDHGEDVLWGGPGADLLFGGSGADRFFFMPGDGRDVVKDFEDDIDELNFRPFGLDSWSAVAARARELGGDVIFDMGGGDEIVIENMSLAQLQDDILF